MIYVLVLNYWDYHHFEKVVGASTSLGAIVGKAAKEEYDKYPIFLENSPAHEKFMKTYSDDGYYLTIKELENEV